MLKIENLEKRYSDGRGVGPLDITLDAGEVVALVGPNGSGKSTAFNSIAGVIKPDRGLFILESREYKRLPQGSFGFLSERPFLFESFTPFQTCQFEREMRSLDVSDKEIKRSLELFNCEGFLRDKVGILSQGMAKRVALTCAFLGSPRIVLLDEPTNALDIKTTLVLKDEIKRKSSEGCIVLISSHVLDFLDGVADKVLFLQEGQIVCSVDPRKESAESVYRRIFLNSIDEGEC